jgi:hypothetical protein
MKEPTHQRILNPTVNIHSQKPQSAPQPSAAIPARFPRLLRHASLEIIPVPELFNQLLALCSLGLVPPFRDPARLLSLVKEALQVLKRVDSEVSLLARPGIGHKTLIHASSLVLEASCFDQKFVRCELIVMG